MAKGSYEVNICSSNACEPEAQTALNTHPEGVTPLQEIGLSDESGLLRWGVFLIHRGLCQTENYPIRLLTTFIPCSSLPVKQIV